jgi:hypothetical protein
MSRDLNSEFEEHEASRKTPFPLHLRPARVFEHRSRGEPRHCSSEAAQSGASAAISRSVSARPATIIAPAPIDGLSLAVDASTIIAGDQIPQYQLQHGPEPGGGERVSDESDFGGNVSPLTRPSDSQTAFSIIGRGAQLRAPSRSQSAAASLVGSKRSLTEVSRPAEQSYPTSRGASRSDQTRCQQHDQAQRTTHERHVPAVADALLLLEGEASMVLDTNHRTRRPPPRSESHVPVVTSKTLITRSYSQHSAAGGSRHAAAPDRSLSKSVVAVSADCAGIRASQGATSLVCLSAELDFQGREITQLVNALVKNQQSQLRELFDDLAATRAAAHDELSSERATHEQALSELQHVLAQKETQWADDRQRHLESDSSKQCLIDCLQSECQMKSESVKMLTDQLNSTQARLETATTRIASLTTALATAEAKLKNATAVAAAAAAVPSSVHRHEPSSGALADNNFGKSAMPAGKRSLSRQPFSFVVTGFRSSERQALEAKIRALGGALVTCDANTSLPDTVSHVVCGSLTPKVVAALFKSGTVVCPADYIHKSAEKQDWIPPSTVRSVVGDQEGWLAQFPAVATDAPAKRDPGTQEVCGVLEACGVELVSHGATSSGGYVHVPSLAALLNEIKPAFLVGRRSG